MLLGSKWAKKDQDWTIITFSFPKTASIYKSGYDELQTKGTSSATTGHFFKNALDFFQSMDEATQQTIIKALNVYGDIAKIKFIRVDGANPDGSTPQADLQFALTSGFGTTGILGVTGDPDASFVAGDFWLDKNGVAYDKNGNPKISVIGYAYFETIFHEIGHALGLSHPHQQSDVNFAAKPAYESDVQVAARPGLTPADHWFMAYTIMLPTTSLGDYPNDKQAAWNIGHGPQSPMMDDIRALQTLYGANYGAHAGNTTYRWDPTTGTETIDEYDIDTNELKASVSPGKPGANVVFVTIWDGYGNDTYDFSSYTTNMTINLQPGKWSTISGAQLSTDGLHFMPGNVYNAYLFNDDPRSLIENAIGGSGNDSITGNQAANKLTGGEGNDQLFGLEGDDTLDGGVGDDTLDGGAGDDTLNGGSGNDIYKFGFGYGKDLIAFWYGGEDRLVFNEGVAASDIIWSRGVGYDLIGSLRGGAETITIQKYYAYFNMEHRMTITLSDGTIIDPGLPVTATPKDYEPGGVNFYQLISGTREKDVITGVAGRIEILQGLDGDDTIDGVNGDDTIDGGAGADRMIGGNDDNVYYVDNLGDDVVEAQWGGYDTVLSFVDSYQLADNVEDLYLMEGVCSGSGNQINNRIFGNASDNIITAAGGDDTIYGGDGKDSIDGGDDSDLLYGEKGDDTILGGDGDDWLDGGDGNDTLIGGAGFNQLFGGDGDDSLVGGDAYDTIDGGAGYDRIFGGEGIDHLYGRDGNDYIDAGSGDDTVEGGAGDDSILGGDGYDALAGGDGDDTIDGGSEHDRLDGGVGDDSLLGGDGDDWLDGGDGKDTLIGGAGFNQLFGGDGDDSLVGGDAYDTIDGGAGDDRIFGGAGIDHLYGMDGNDYIDAGSDEDTVEGGAGDDTILGGAGNDSLAGGDGKDLLDGGAGNDNIDGGAGVDTVVIHATRASARITRNADGSLTITSADGGVTITNVEYLKFDDQVMHVNPEDDFNGDGVSDILLQHIASTQCFAWDLSRLSAASGVKNIMDWGTGPWIPTRDAANDWRMQATGDFNGDGVSDILLQNMKNNQLQIWDLDGKTDALRTMTTMDWGSISTNPGSNFKVKATGDFNNDGVTDIVLQNESTGDVRVWEMSSSPSASHQFSVLKSVDVTGAHPEGFTNEWQVKATGDFNGDGYSDILLQNALTRDCMIWQQDKAMGTSHFGFVGWTPPEHWEIKGTGDFNGDGKSDILLQNSLTTQCYIWQVNGTWGSGDWRGRELMGLSDYGAVSWTPVKNDANNWEVKGTGDYNGDGKSDIFLQNSVNGQCFVWELDGSVNSHVFATPTWGVVGWTPPSADWQA